VALGREAKTSGPGLSGGGRPWAVGEPEAMAVLLT